MPVSVPRKRIGRASRPVETSASLTRPVRPSSTIQPNERTMFEVKSGTMMRMTQARRHARHFTMRTRYQASGKPISRQITVVSSAMRNVTHSTSQ